MTKNKLQAVINVLNVQREVINQIEGGILLSIHNLTYYQRLVNEARAAIEQDKFEEFRLARLKGWGVSIDEQ